jgi:hypothetical protein
MTIAAQHPYILSPLSANLDCRSKCGIRRLQAGGDAVRLGESDFPSDLPLTLRIADGDLHLGVQPQ